MLFVHGSSSRVITTNTIIATISSIRRDAPRPVGRSMPGSTNHCTIHRESSPACCCSIRQTLVNYKPIGMAASIMWCSCSRVPHSLARGLAQPCICRDIASMGPSLASDRSSQVRYASRFCRLPHETQGNWYGTHDRHGRSLLVRGAFVNQRVARANRTRVRCATGFESVCYKCGALTQGNYCPDCRRSALQCSFCHATVRGLSSFCLECGHGGHVDHLQQWFTKQTLCPMRGCGCRCLQNPPHTLNASPMHTLAPNC